MVQLVYKIKFLSYFLFDFVKELVFWNVYVWTILNLLANILGG